MLVGVSSAASQAYRGDVRVHVKFTGKGAVSNAASRRICRSNCTISGRRGELLTLRALPQPHYAFKQWSGACVGAVPQCVLSLGPHLSVRAVFSRLPVHVDVTVGGNGSVREQNGDCSEGCDVAAGATVNLVAKASAGNVFSSWGGACAASTSNTCSIKARDDGRPVSAKFALSPTKGTTSASAAGAAVSISLKPKAQNVPGGGAAIFALVVANIGGQTLSNLRVTDALAPNCAYDGTVAGYDGTLAVGQTLSYSCTRRNVEKSFENVATALAAPSVGPDVSAQDVARVTLQVFSPVEAYPVSVTSSGVGGTVTSKPAGISCGKSGGSCTSNFNGHVTLTAHAITGYYFARWKQNGACNAVKGPTCIVLVPVSNPRIGPVATFARCTPGGPGLCRRSGG